MTTHRAYSVEYPIVTRCGFGMQGCQPPTDDERLQSYAARLAGHYRPHDHAVRAAAGLALVKAWKKLWRKKAPRKAVKKHARKQNNVVPMRRRA